jgi:hypothetical protein
MDIPEGYCQCGCGQKTNICKENRPSRGYFAGKPTPCIRGHRIHNTTCEKPIEERFWKKVQKCSPDECWNWFGAKKEFGYGIIRYEKSIVRAHRVSYEMTYGKIPDGMYVLHRCDNPPCVNPAHLFLGTHQDNMNDMCDKGRIARKLTIEKAREIKQLLAEESMSRKAIARIYGVNPSLINCIANGKKWKRA